MKKERTGDRKGHEWEKKAPEVMMWFNELFYNIKCRICFRLRPVLRVQGEGYPVAPRWNSQWIIRMQAKKKKRKMLIFRKIICQNHSTLVAFHTVLPFKLKCLRRRCIWQQIEPKWPLVYVNLINCFNIQVPAFTGIESSGYLLPFIVADLCALCFLLCYS